MKHILLPIFFCSFLVSTSAQFSFLDHTEIYLDSSIFYKSQIIAIADADNDGLDDVAILGRASSSSAFLKINYQNEPNTPFTCKSLATIGTPSQFSICIADLNNNGQNEAIIGGVYDFCDIIATSNMDGDTSILGILPESGEVFFQGTNIVDINNDGLLDVFACHDDGANYIWENEGGGQFKVNTDWIDFSINGSLEEPASGNYGSVWTDIDFDGDLDLYIAKCRFNVTDSTDVRRINTLYINNGDGTFTEKAEEAGLDIGWQSWTADFQDINNDGYFDLFLTNHEHDSQIFLNNGSGIFTEIHNTGVNITQNVTQGLLRDFDNDGWVDIFVSGQAPQFFINNRDSTFTELFGPWTDEPVRSFAIGDLNNDGYLDAYAGYRPGGDRIWINSAESGNNHFAVRLQGIISNKSAIGSRVEIYGDWGLQIREVRSGESYGIMNSMTQYFGLGESEAIDSMIIRWPSGNIQTEYNLDINSKVLIKEKCSFLAPDLNIKEDLVLCVGDSITLSPEGDFAGYEWSDGSTNSELIATSTGSYYVMLEDSIGCTAQSLTINIQFDSELSPTIEVIENQEICEGDEALLIATHQNNVAIQTWSDGSQGDTLFVTESGIYTFTQENACGTFTSNQIEITVIESNLAPSIEVVGDQEICEGDEALLITTHLNNVDNQMWSDGSLGDTLFVTESGNYTFIQENICGIFTSNQIEITVIESNLTPSIEIVGNPEICGGDEALLITTHLNNVDNQMWSDGSLGDTLSVTESGNYTFIQENVCGTFTSNQIEVTVFEIPLAPNTTNDTIVKGEVAILTAEGTDISWYSDDVSTQVISTGNDFEILDLEETTTFYASQSSGNGLCESQRTPTLAIVEEAISTQQISSDDIFKLSPNPVHDILNIKLYEDIEFPVLFEMFDSNARLVTSKSINKRDSSIDVSYLEKGVYIVLVKSKESIFTKSIIIY